MGTSRLFRGSAEAYDRFVGRYGPNLSRELIAAAGVRAGQTVLDVGCGPGALTTTLAALVGADRVSAVDPSEPFAEACRDRVPGADVWVAPAEALPFEDDRFDTTLSQLVVNFLGDAPGGLSEMRRVTRPEGVVAGCTWDYAGGMTMLRGFWDAARALDPDLGGSADEGATMRYADPESLGELWRGAGLRDVDVSKLVAEASYEDFDDLWQPFLAGIGPAGAYATSLGPEAQAALRDEFAKRLGQRDEPFTLTAQAWCAVGTA